MAFIEFIKRHKILTIICTFVLVFVISTVLTLNYFLSKINITYDNTPPSTAPYTDVNSNSAAENDDVKDLRKLSKKKKKALKDADDEIRRNLDNSKKWYSEQVMNVALFGIDYGSKSYPYGRSDAMIIVSINKAINKVKLISLSRTSYSAIPGYPNTRLSHAHGYGGAPLAIAAIENNYKFRIDKYIGCSFDSFMKIIDAFDGINVQMTAAEAKTMRQYNKGFDGEGIYNLNGDLALKFVRIRKLDSDRARTGRQRRVLMSLAQKCKNITATQAINILNEVLPLVTTDFTKSEIVYQLASAIGYLKWDMEEHLIPAKPYNLVLRDDFEVIIMDWKYEVKYLHDVMYENVIPLYED